jgi:hypothetical protein
MAGRLESLNGRECLMAGPLSFLQDIEAEIGEEGLLVDGLDEALQLPYVEDDLRGSLG